MFVNAAPCSLLVRKFGKKKLQSGVPDVYYIAIQMFF